MPQEKEFQMAQDYTWSQQIIPIILIFIGIIVGILCFSVVILNIIDYYPIDNILIGIIIGTVNLVFFILLGCVLSPARKYILKFDTEELLLTWTWWFFPFKRKIPYSHIIRIQYFEWGFMIIYGRIKYLLTFTIQRIPFITLSNEEIIELKHQFGSHGVH